MSESVKEVGVAHFEIPDLNNKQFYGVYTKTEDEILHIIEEFDNKPEAYERAIKLANEKYKCPYYINDPDWKNKNKNKFSEI